MDCIVLWTDKIGYRRFWNGADADRALVVLVHHVFVCGLALTCTFSRALCIVLTALFCAFFLPFPRRLPLLRICWSSTGLMIQVTSLWIGRWSRVRRYFVRFDKAPCHHFLCGFFFSWAIAMAWFCDSTWLHQCYTLHLLRFSLRTISNWKSVDGHRLLTFVLCLSANNCLTFDYMDLVWTFAWQVLGLCSVWPFFRWRALESDVSVAFLVDVAVAPVLSFWPAFATSSSPNLHHPSYVSSHLQGHRLNRHDFMSNPAHLQTQSSGYTQDSLINSRSSLTRA